MGVGTHKYVDMVIVVADGSTDMSREIAERLGVNVVNHPKNLGYSVAIKSCLEAGQKEGADVLVTIDGDGQHNPGDITSPVRPILDGSSDIVVSSRFNGGARKEFQNIESLESS